SSCSCPQTRGNGACARCSATSASTNERAASCLIPAHDGAKLRSVMPDHVLRPLSTAALGVVLVSGLGCGAGVTRQLNPAGQPAGPLPPSQLSGVALWLDASTGVTAGAGGGVTAWADRSGQDHTAFPLDDALPTLVADAWQGHPAVHFGL